MTNLLEAIAREEGWFAVPPARNRRNNNPGNIEYGPFAIAHGATATDGRFAIFASPQDGFGCLAALLSAPAYQGLTVAEALAKYAPANENDTARYLANVCAWSGAKPDQLITPLVKV